jgi:serine/threonine-protein kinase
MLFVACDASRGPAAVVDPAVTSLPPSPSAPVAPTSIDVRPAAVRLTVGASYALSAIGSDPSGRTVSGMVVDWRSSDTNVVAVDAERGVVIGRAIGAATIIATTSGLRDSARVIVSTTNPFAIAFSSLSTVGNYACGLEAVTNLAYCWGDNHSGALGIGDAPWLELPMLVNNGTKRFRSLSVSAYWNCAIEVGTDMPYCWGLTTDLPQTDSWPNAVTIPTLVGGGRFRFASIVAGTLVTCGIEVGTSRAYCWGDGELVGDGAGIRRSTPTLVGGEGSDLRFATMSASPGVVCGIEAQTARALCWGRNESGQLGDGTTTDHALPTLVANGTIRFSTISAGESVVCGVEAQSARALCWGANSLGQLGDGSVTSRHVPTPVTGAGLRFSSIEAGANMVCALEEGTQAAYCWGRNKNGSLGDGSTADRRVPTRVAGDIRFAAVSTGGAGGGYGGYETCGVEATTGRAFCWGFARLVPTPFESVLSWPPSIKQPNAPIHLTRAR